MDNDTQHIVGSETPQDDGDFRSQSFEAAKAIGELLRATYGPLGRDKLIMDHIGSGYVSNQGTDILDRIEVTDPIGKLVIDGCEFSERYADGSTFAVLLARELLEEAESLLEMGVSPPDVVRGYERGNRIAESALEDVAVPLNLDERERYALVSTATGGQLTHDQIEHLRRVALDAADVLAPEVSLDRIHFEESIRLSLDSSRVVAGAILRGDVPHRKMPRDVADADVLLLSDPVRRPDTEELLGEEDVTLDSVEAVDGVIESTDRVFQERIDAILETGADVVVCRGNLHTEVITALADAGVLTLHEQAVSQEDFEMIQQAVGGTSVMPENVEDATLGHAGRVIVNDVGSGTKKGIIFADCPDTEVATIVVHAGTASGSGQAKRILKQAIGSIAAAYDDPRAVPGGGAAELEAAHAIRSEPAEPGPDALATEAYADALEATVAELIRNAGSDALDVLPELKAEHANGHEDASFDADSGGIASAYERGVIDPHETKRLAMGSGTEIATSLLRIDGMLPRVDSGGPDIESDGNPMAPPDAGWGSGNADWT
jgi:chaperonin GroEL (HSP60 family)